MITYKILVKDNNGNALGEFNKFRNLKFSKRLNNYGECTFDIPVDDPKASDLIGLRLYTVWIYRNDLLLWAGEQVLRSGRLDDKGDNWATITCYDWLEQLNSRFTVLEKIYSYQNGSDIAWDLINTTQADDDGDLGITRGLHPETTWREKTYTNQNIMDALISLANLQNGFDFEITNEKIFNIYPVMGIDRSDKVFLEYGVNVKTITITEDFSNPATRAIVLGQTFTVSDQIRIERNDDTLRGIFGLRESLISQMEQSEMATFEATGDALLRKNGEPLMKLTMDIVRSTTPTIEDFSLGDLIKVKVKRGVYNINEVFRVFGWSVDYNEDDTETLSLTVGNFNLGEGA